MCCRENGGSANGKWDETEFRVPKKRKCSKRVVSVKA